MSISTRSHQHFRAGNQGDDVIGSRVNFFQSNVRTRNSEVNSGHDGLGRPRNESMTCASRPGRGVQKH
jgi:hypothetical protein